MNAETYLNYKTWAGRRSLVVSRSVVLLSTNDQRLTTEDRRPVTNS
jgi:hypothetical protein